jgi:AcrR family transcriptional regulator
MIAATETLLCERGLGGAGIKQLVARSGAPIGSVYHFFPGGKAQLVAETLRVHAGKADQLYRQYLSDKEKPLADRIRSLFRTAAEGFDRAGGQRSCAVAAVTLDLGAADAELREVCRRSFDHWVTTIASQLPWKNEARRLSFARMLIVTLEGAFVLARADGHGDAFRTAGEWLAATVSSAESTLKGAPDAHSSPGRRSGRDHPRRVSRAAGRHPRGR